MCLESHIKTSPPTPRRNIQRFRTLRQLLKMPHHPPVSHSKTHSVGESEFPARTPLRPKWVPHQPSVLACFDKSNSEFDTGDAIWIITCHNNLHIQPTNTISDEMITAKGVFTVCFTNWCFTHGQTRMIAFIAGH